MTRFKATYTGDGFSPQTVQTKSNRISDAALTSRHALNGPQITAKGKVMGVFTATARNLFVCPVVLLVSYILNCPLASCFGSKPKAGGSTPKAGGSKPKADGQLR